MAAQAVDAIGAFVVVNDFSARDVQRAEMTTGLGPQKSKHFASSMSATAVTADEILPRVTDLSGSVSINGRTVSTVSSAGMQWSLGEVLAHASRNEQLLAGELFATGTLPVGNGQLAPARRHPHADRRLDRGHRAHDHRPHGIDPDYSPVSSR